MTTLVTGAPGWLGTRLVKALCDEGRTVRCLVLRGVATSPLDDLPVEVVRGDVRDKVSLEVAVKDINVVFHCAGIIHTKFFKARDFYSVNRDGTRNLLEVAVPAGVEKFIYVSSNSAQGYNVNRLMTENQPCNPETDYGKSKCQAELIVNFFHEKYEIQTAIARPCPYYGPGQPPRHRRLMRMVKEGRAPIFGDGTSLRSLTYIDNLIQGLLLIESRMDDANGKTYWIADEKPYTWIEYLEAIAVALGVELKTRHYPKFIAKACAVVDKALGSFGMYWMDVHVAWESIKDMGVSIEKAKRELGYRPQIELREGMRKTVEWCRENDLL